jgi:hypothetical protein
MPREPHVLMSMPVAALVRERSRTERLSPCAAIFLHRRSLAGRLGDDRRSGSRARLAADWAREPIRLPHLRAERLPCVG